MYVSAKIEKLMVWLGNVGAFNPITQESEAGISFLVPGHPSLQELVPREDPRLQKSLASTKNYWL